MMIILMDVVDYGPSYQRKVRLPLLMFPKKCRSAWKQIYSRGTPLNSCQTGKRGFCLASCSVAV